MLADSQIVTIPGAFLNNPSSPGTDTEMGWLGRTASSTGFHITLPTAQAPALCLESCQPILEAPSAPSDTAPQPKFLLFIKAQCTSKVSCLLQTHGDGKLPFLSLIQMKMTKRFLSCGLLKRTTDTWV